MKKNTNHNADCLSVYVLVIQAFLSDFTAFYAIYGILMAIANKTRFGPFLASIRSQEELGSEKER